MVQRQQLSAMGTTPQPAHFSSIEVATDKAEYLKKIARMSTGALKILAEKSDKPGIEKKLEAYKNFI